MLRTSISLVLVLFLLASPLAASRADEVTLTGGTQLRGVVLERSEEGLRLLLPEGVELRFEAADIGAVERTEDDPRPGEYLRYEEDEAADRLLTAVVHFVHPEHGTRVDLVGVTHIADATYYRTVQGLLEHVDVVLYEAVKPAGEDVATRAAQAGEEGLGRVQARLAEFLGLVFQMDAMRYDRPHFVHADLTLEAFQALSAEAGGQDTMDLERVQGLVKMIEPALDMLVKMGEKMPSLQLTLKRTLGRLLAKSASDLASLLPAESMELLIDKRNAVVVERLAEQMETGDAETIAVFYGAGHLADLERRLVEESGFVRAGARWLTAWKVGAE